MAGIPKTPRVTAGASGETSMWASAEKEVTMFETLQEESTQPRGCMMMMVRIGALTIAVLALGAAVYFFAFLPYASH